MWSKYFVQAKVEKLGKLFDRLAELSDYGEYEDEDLDELDNDDE